MTLKVRLAAMMIVILAAVVALQYLLMERERRDLALRLSEISSNVDRSTLDLVHRAHALARNPDPIALDAFFQQVGSDSLRGRVPTDVRVFVWADSTAKGLSPDSLRALRARWSVRVPPSPPGVTRFVEETRDQVIQRGPGADGRAKDGAFTRRVVMEIHDEKASPGLKSSWETVGCDTLVASAKAESAGIMIVAGRERKGEDHDIVVNLPLAGLAGDSLYSLQMRYPLGQIEEELARSRRRGLWSMIAIFSLGILGTVLVAVQFTRPIQGLKDSFQRVERGDLQVKVKEARRDEIGELTHSFNEMVDRLRDSREIERRLGEAEHLASLGRLAAGVAHEVRNPLNAILLTLQHLRDKTAEAERLAAERGEGFEKYFELVAGEIARLDKLVSAFLDLSRSGEIARAEVNVADELRAAAELFAPVARERGIALRAEVPSSLPLTGDPARLPMVWHNLISNALDAVARGGTVRVAARAQTDGIEVVIEDDGPGVPEALQSRIWEPFVSGKSQGTGLGLAIVRSVVERHGGTVSLEAPATGGARFRVYFPAAPAPRATSPLPRPAGAA